MKILAIEKELKNGIGVDIKPLLKDEARKAWELYSSGVFREIYFTQGKPIAVIILECDSVDEAKKALGSLPLVKGGYIDFDIMPLTPYPGFSRLFAEEK